MKILLMVGSDLEASFQVREMGRVERTLNLSLALSRSCEV